MNYSSLDFVPYEGTFHDRVNALVAEKWFDEENGIRVYDDHSVSPTGSKFYWVEQLRKASDGGIMVKVIGYQVNEFI